MNTDVNGPENPTEQEQRPVEPMPTLGDPPHDNHQGADSRRLAAEVLATGGSYTDAGEACGRSKRTIIRWMADADFARLVADLRAERLSEVAGRLAELAPRAVEVLAEAMTSELAAERLRGAQLALEWSIRLRRAADLEARMLEVERRQGVRPDRNEEGDAA